MGQQPALLKKCSFRERPAMNRLLLLLAFTLLVACSKKQTVVEADTVEYFKLHLKADMNYTALTQQFGQPEADRGSGIHIYVYELKNGTAVWIGYTDKILYARHMDGYGQLIANLL